MSTGYSYLMWGRNRVTGHVRPRNFCSLIQVTFAINRHAYMCIYLGVPFTQDKWKLALHFFGVISPLFHPVLATAVQYYFGVSLKLLSLRSNKLSIYKLYTEWTSLFGQKGNTLILWTEPTNLPKPFWAHLDRTNYSIGCRHRYDLFNEGYEVDRGLSTTRPLISKLLVHSSVWNNFKRKYNTDFTMQCYWISNQFLLYLCSHWKFEFPGNLYLQHLLEPSAVQLYTNG